MPLPLSYTREPTVHERWAVFSSLSNLIPRDIVEICDVTDLPTVRVVRVLCQLADDGLCVLHSFDANEWRLSDDPR